ncbi:MAG: NAD(+)/NADH kinase [Thermomicrobiales bacterium]|nr:MAG: NAD(+)/NADH kinase [Thermomicrobiales bacterium]
MADPTSPRPKALGLVAALSKPEAHQLAADIQERVKSIGITIVPEDELSPNAAKQVDAILVLGGDGLMMRAAKAYPNTPLLGINFGKVGFLAKVERNEWESALDALISGNYTIEESSTLNATIQGGHGAEDQGWAINDVVIRSGVRMIDIELYVDGYYVNTFPGDGIIVATSRGSTAYCMAAGGPILTAGVKGFAIVPISCHSPIRTPMVVAESAKIDLLFKSRYDASLILDGRVTGELAPDDVVRVRCGENMCRLISVGETDFYEAFRTKFNFRIRPELEPARVPESIGGARGATW